MKGYELHIFEYIWYIWVYLVYLGFLIPEFSVLVLKAPQTHLKQKTHQYCRVKLFRFKRKLIINVKHLQVL